jgi:hypothetical protein
VFSADDLLNKLKEIESLKRDNTDADGSLTFEPTGVMAGLELAKRMIKTKVCEE